MYGNSRFRQASKAETPQFASAEALQGQAAANAKAQENAQLSNNLMGAGALYNQGMGENTPLADLITEAFGPEETISALRAGADMGAAIPDTYDMGANVPLDVPSMQSTAAPLTAATGDGLGMTIDQYRAMLGG
tara:strand:+ start:102 stop:503 length:402 start_codon:yes stop_codon:yes gene_type:complete